MANIELAADFGGGLGRSAAARSRARGDWLADWVIYSPLVATTFFCKVGVPPFTARGLGFGFPLLFVSLLIGIVCGRVQIDPKRAVYFAVLVALLGAMQVAWEEPFSMSSFVFLSAVSLTYIFAVPRPARDPNDALRFFANVAAIIAALGILQFFLQFVAGSRLAFPIENFTPHAFLVQGYHYLNPLAYAAATLKSNGVFLQEPSFFSQLLAVALITEMQLFKRKLRIGIMVLAVLVSYSGTGLLILLVCLPVYFLLERRLAVLAGVVGVVGLAALFAVPLKLDVIINRISEFGDPRSSASMRFVGWVYLLGDELFSDSMRALFGYGAGSFRETAARVAYPVAEMMHSKMIIEYGLVGALAYIGFLFYCIFTAPAPFVIRLAVAALHFMAGAYSEPVTGIALTTIILTPRGAARQAAPAPVARAAPAAGD